jgi:hypothetical protein
VAHGRELYPASKHGMVDTNLTRSDCYGTTRHVFGGTSPCFSFRFSELTHLVQMLTHAGLLDLQHTKYELPDCQQEPERAWEDWKGSEAKSR